MVAGMVVIFVVVLIVVVVVVAEFVVLVRVGDGDGGLDGVVYLGYER